VERGFLFDQRLVDQWFEMLYLKVDGSLGLSPDSIAWLTY